MSGKRFNNNFFVSVVREKDMLTVMNALGLGSFPADVMGQGRNATIAEIAEYFCKFKLRNRIKPARIIA